MADNTVYGENCRHKKARQVPGFPLMSVSQTAVLELFQLIPEMGGFLKLKVFRRFIHLIFQFAHGLSQFRPAQLCRINTVILRSLQPPSSPPWYSYGPE